MKKTLIISNILFICIIIALTIMLIDARLNLENEAQPWGTKSEQTPDISANRAVYPLGDSLSYAVVDEYIDSDIYVRKHTLRTENLLDQTFELYWKLDVTDIEKKNIAAIYADLWRAEAAYAFELLNEHASLNNDLSAQSADEILNALDLFTALNGDLYANYYYSDMYKAQSPYFENNSIRTGSGWSGAYSISRAAQYRTYAFYLYDLLANMGTEPALAFDPEEIHSEWGYLLE
ncbi:hypothetical protein LJC42_08925 [Eubacteriales bacterium OttesenSCG-928-K08]|nr:hypothetical protein [Eubacteriales bacterium OttesenSCG-928-K08]